MNRDSRGRFVKRSSDADLIRKMDFNLNRGAKEVDDFAEKKRAEMARDLRKTREIPVKDNRKKVTIPIVNFNNKPDTNGRVYNIDAYNIDKELVNRAIKNINKLGLGSIEHPLKVDDLFDKFTSECSKKKKSDSDLLKTLSENINQDVKKVRCPGFANSRRISWFGNNVGNFSASIVENLKDFVVSFNDTIMVSINIEANTFPNIILFLRELKKYDYFTIVFNTYDIHGFADKNETFDGFKLFDLTYVGEKDIYNITLTKDNI